MSELDQKSLERLTKVGFEANVLLQDLVDEVGFIKLELCEMREINLHRRLLVLFYLLCLVDVEPNRALVLVAISVILVVRVFFAQSEPTDELVI
jgi:hypothetical protein